MTNARVVNCLIVEDQTLMAELLCSMLRTSPAIKTVAIANSVERAIQSVDTLQPNLLILDLALPDGNGQEVGVHLLKYNPNPSIILLSAQLSDFICDPRLLPHIHSIIDKTSAYKELSKAISELHNHNCNDQEIEAAQLKLDMMSTREKEVFLLIGRGKKSKEISSILKISVSTVESHRKAISQCLGTSGADLVRIAAVHCFKIDNSLLEGSDCFTD